MAITRLQVAVFPATQMTMINFSHYTLLALKGLTFLKKWKSGGGLVGRGHGGGAFYVTPSLVVPLQEF